MHKAIKRYNGRQYDKIRPVKISYNVFGYAAGSVLFEAGRTKVLCTISMQFSIPSFLRGKNSGWLTAEYAMLPSSTNIRMPRETSLMKKNGRSVEISRLIGRALRAIVDLTALPDRTIVVDCDVLQADGGTRTASITGAYLALKAAQEKWLGNNVITQPFLSDTLAALSICVIDGQLLVDPDFAEDSKAEADFNFVVTKSGNIIEIQGGAEKKTIAWDLFDQMCLLVKQGASQLFNFLAQQKLDHSKQNISRSNTYSNQGNKLPLFSLKNRQSKTP